MDKNECADNSSNCEELNLKCHNYEGGFFCGDAQSCGFSEMRRFRQAGCCKVDSSETCGRQSIVSRGRIIGGDNATRKQWPWMVWIKYRDFEGRDRLCGGSLISSEWVLTAAHCLMTVKDKFLTCDGCLEMNMGVHDTSLGYFDEIHRTRLQAKKIVIHEKFEPQGLFNDIALIQIAPTDIETSDYVKPVCLPAYEEPVAGTKCFIAGWGKTLEATSSNVLKDTEITVSDIDECAANYAAKTHLVSKVRVEDHICAKEPNLDGEMEYIYRDACQGDSGGPLMCQRCESCNWYVAGVVSFGDDCGKTDGVYTKVARYETWIRNNMKLPVLPKDETKGISCQDCCEFIKISGDSGQIERQGIYQIDFGRENVAKRKVYKQLYREPEEKNFLWFMSNEKFNIWFVKKSVTYFLKFIEQAQKLSLPCNALARRHFHSVI
jgi:hypothetical protein